MDPELLTPQALSGAPGQGPVTGAAASQITNEEAAAVLKTLLDADVDPRNSFPKTGIPGFRDAVPKEVEKLLSEEQRLKLEEWYGPEEVSVVRPDAGMFEQARTYVLGRPATDVQSEQARAAARELQRRSGITSGPERGLAELRGYVPSLEELKGEPPPGTPRYLQDLFREKPYKIATEPAEVAVAEKYWGLKDLGKGPEFAARARDAMAWIAQLHTIDEAAPQVDDKGKQTTPGFAAEIIGPMIVEDFNGRFRSGENDKKVTVEELDLKFVDLPRGPRLTFINPSTGNRTTLDPAKYEWGDVVELLPEALVIGADVVGAIGGSLLASRYAGPGVGTAVGTIFGGGLGAFSGRIVGSIIGLEKAGYARDPSRRGFVHPNTEKVISYSDIMLNAGTDFMWSAGGGALASTAYRLGRAIMTRGTTELENFVPEEQFIKAVKEYGESQLKLTLDKAGVKPTASIILRSRGNKLLGEAEAAVNMNPTEVTALRKEGASLLESAKAIERIEQRLAGIAPRVTVSERVRDVGIEESGVPGIGTVVGTSPTAFGAKVTKGTQSEADQINLQLDELELEGRRLIEDFRATMTGTTEDAATLGRNLNEQAKLVLGPKDGTGDIGIYTQYRKLANQANLKNRKPFDLTPAYNLVRKIDKDTAVSMRDPFPPELMKRQQDRFNALRAGKVNYTTVQNDIDYIKEHLADASGVQAKNLGALLAAYKKIRNQGLKQIDNELGLTGKNSLVGRVEAIDQQLTDFSNLWANSLGAGLTEGTFSRVADKLFKITSPDEVRAIVGQLKSNGMLGDQEIELLRNIFKLNFKNSLARVDQPLEPTVAGRTISIGLDKDKFTEIPVRHAEINKFIDDNAEWIKILFPEDPKFSRYADDLAGRGRNLQRELGRLQKAETELRNLPWVQEAFTVDDNLAYILTNEPQRVLDIALNQVKNKDAVKAVKRALRHLPKEEKAIANAQLKALVWRKLLRPGDKAAVATDVVPSAMQATRESVDYINNNLPMIREVYGFRQANNLKTFFNDVDSILTSRAGAEQGTVGTSVTAKSGGPLTELGLIGAKVWVGVLNRRARALTLGSKFLGAGTLSRFEKALMDPELLAKLIRKRRAGPKSKFMVNLIGQMTGLNPQEINSLIQETETFPTMSLPEASIEAMSAPP